MGDGNTAPRLPDEVEHVRSTDVFTADSMPAGLRRAHHLAAGVWGVLRVLEGEVIFVSEETDLTLCLTSDTHWVIEPSVLHHVEPDEMARFVIDFYRRPCGDGS